jgi:hypothetical protein
MDSESKVEPNFDAMKPAGAPEAAPAAAAKDGAAFLSWGTGETPKQGPEKPNPGPKLPPIPSSALVVLPPSKRQFDAKEEARAKTGRAGKRRWLRYGSRAALLLILCGAAFAAGGHFLGASPSVGLAGIPASWQFAKNDRDAHPATAALGSEMQDIQARLDSLRAAPDDIRALRKSVDELKASLDAEKTQATNSIAQLSAKLDQFEREPKLTQTALERSGRGDAADPRAIQATLDRAARTERGEPMTTASIPAASEPQDAMTEDGRPLAEPRRQPPLLSNFVVRDVYDGIALVEGPEGAIEVMPGDTIPGAGVVKSIERRGGGWIVLTSRGLVGYAGD